MLYCGNFVTQRAFRKAQKHKTNQTQEASVYSHGRPIRRRKRRYILTADQSDAGSAGIFSRQTNQTQKAPVYSKAFERSKSD
eukprot:1185740-Prorocentrum_minimum.AAC.2